MQELLRFLADYQRWIYIICGLGALIYAHRLYNAWSEWHSTIFGLERESAQHRLNASLAMVVLLVLMIVAEFMIVTFVLPEWPQVIITSTPENIDPMLTRPVDGIENTDTSGSSVTIMETPEGGIIQTDENGNSVPNQTEAAGVPAVSSSGCINGQLEWISPKNSEEISGKFDLYATINMQDMGFYQYLYAPINDQENWKEIAANSTPVLEGRLGLWSTEQITNGDYVLRLIVWNKNETQLAHCDVSIRVMNKTE